MNSLDKMRPQYTMLYFSAAWNPVCAQIERDYENLVNAHGEFTHIRVDCDKTPFVKNYFDARVEPQFIFLINGGEIDRVVGYNFELISKRAQKVVVANSTDQFGFHGRSGEAWERFYDDFDKWSRYGEHDRDGFRGWHDFNSDQYRGPGTPNP